MLLLRCSFGHLFYGAADNNMGYKRAFNLMVISVVVQILAGLYFWSVSSASRSTDS
jgi:hypothetical protein